MKPNQIKELSLEDQEALAQSYMSLPVHKKSKKPFKSGNIVNTVSGYQYMPELSDIRNKPVLGLTFYEDSSVVEISIIKTFN